MRRRAEVGAAAGCRPQGWDAGHKAGMQAARLGCRPQGWDAGRKAGMQASRPVAPQPCCRQQKSKRACWVWTCRRQWRGFPLPRPWQSRKALTKHSCGSGGQWDSQMWQGPYCSLESWALGRINIWTYSRSSRGVHFPSFTHACTLSRMPGSEQMLSVLIWIKVSWAEMTSSWCCHQSLAEASLDHRVPSTHHVLIPPKLYTSPGSRAGHSKQGGGHLWPREGPTPSRLDLCPTGCTLSRAGPHTGELTGRALCLSVWTSWVHLEDD